MSESALSTARRSSVLPQRNHPSSQHSSRSAPLHPPDSQHLPANVRELIFSKAFTNSQLSVFLALLWYVDKYLSWYISWLPCCQCVLEGGRGEEEAIGWLISYALSATLLVHLRWARQLPVPSLACWLDFCPTWSWFALLSCKCDNPPHSTLHTFWSQAAQLLSTDCKAFRA